MSQITPRKTRSKSSISTNQLQVLPPSVASIRSVPSISSNQSVPSVASTRSVQSSLGNCPNIPTDETQFEYRNKRSRKFPR